MNADATDHDSADEDEDVLHVEPTERAAVETVHAPTDTSSTQDTWIFQSHPGSVEYLLGELMKLRGSIENAPNMQDAMQCLHNMESKIEAMRQHTQTPLYGWSPMAIFSPNLPVYYNFDDIMQSQSLAQSGSTKPGDTCSVQTMRCSSQWLEERLEAMVKRLTSGGGAH